jgi:hypothetical protein
MSAVAGSWQSRWSFCRQAPTTSRALSVGEVSLLSLHVFLVNLLLFLVESIGSREKHTGRQISECITFFGTTATQLIKDAAMSDMF